jgi:hypothetical protein
MLQSQAILRTGLIRRTFFTTAAKAEAAKATTTTTPPPSKSSPEKKKKRLVVAVGGNALQRRGDRLTIENMMVRNCFVRNLIYNSCSMKRFSFQQKSDQYFHALLSFILNLCILFSNGRWIHFSALLLFCDSIAWLGQKAAAVMAPTLAELAKDNELGKAQLFVCPFGFDGQVFSLLELNGILNQHFTPI